jgi:hypothetical protein
VTTKPPKSPMSLNESEEIFMAYVEALPAEDDYYQIFLHLEEDGHHLSTALRVIELSGATLDSLSIVPSPAAKKKIAVFRFNDRDLKSVVVDLIRNGFLEVKGCGPRKWCVSRIDVGRCDRG